MSGSAGALLSGNVLWGFRFGILVGNTHGGKEAM